ncbi:hypothetical protein R1T08_02870 [Streptomyces sp. SBC-4]|nr:hypothetical protein [Streptomyces sp. SBC-4]MDV5143279.1 hypothetical protein [Streptomyces sp. SBC-4]
MTAPRREPAEPTTPHLHDQWAASRLDDALEDLADLVGAFLTTAESPDDPDVPPTVTP